MDASIVITTYNRPKFLAERSLRSALKQTYPDYEIIVVDDCSTEKYHVPDKVRYYKLPENKGLSYARNFGIAQATGKYVVCLDDDNELMPDFLKETLNSNADAVGVGRVIQYKDFAQQVTPKLSEFTAIDWGWLIRKEVFDVIKYDEKMKANEDTDFGIRLAKRFTREVINKPLCIAYDTENPKESLSYPTKRELDGMTYFFNKNLHEYTNYPNELKHLYRLMGRKFYRGGHRLKGLGYFWQSFHVKPALDSFAHLFFILFGWYIYDKFMSLEERIR